MAQVQNARRGFTMMELLVVIGILALLSSIAMVNLNAFRSRARDAQRIGDLHQMRQALLLYYEEHGEYPSYGPLGDAARSTNIAGRWTTLDAQLTTIKLPVDPLNVGSSPFSDNKSHLYYYATDGQPNPQEYDLVTALENLHDLACPSKEWVQNTTPAPASWCGWYYSQGAIMISDHNKF